MAPEKPLSADRQAHEQRGLRDRREQEAADSPASAELIDEGADHHGVDVDAHQAGHVAVGGHGAHRLAEHGAAHHAGRTRP